MARSVLLNRLFPVYVVLIHIFLAIVLWQSDYFKIPSRDTGRSAPAHRVEITPHYYRMLMYHHRSIDIVPDKAIIIIGDSIIQGLCAAAIAPNSINYGIGSDTTFGVMQRIPVYMPALMRAEAVVMLIGTNDFNFRSVPETTENYQQIIKMIPDSCTTVISSVLPVDESARKDLAGRNLLIAELNRELQKMAEKHANVVFLDNTEYFDADGDGLLDKDFQTGDGVHINSMGNAVLAGNIKHIIEEAENRNKAQ